MEEEGPRPTHWLTENNDLMVFKEKNLKNLENLKEKQTQIITFYYFCIHNKVDAPLRHTVMLGTHEWRVLHVIPPQHSLVATVRPLLFYVDLPFDINH